MFRLIFNRFNRYTESPKHEEILSISPKLPELEPETHVIDVEDISDSLRKIGVQPPVEFILKSKLIKLLPYGMERSGLGVWEIAKLLSISPKKVESLLWSEDGGGFSLFRLFRILIHLGFKVEIVVKV